MSCGHDVVIYPKPAHDNDVYNEILRTDRNRVSHTYRKRPLTLIIILICVSVLFLLSLICYFTLRIIMQKDYPVVTDSINASTHWIEEEYLSPTENELNLETTVSTIVTETEIETPAESRYISRSRKVAEIEYTEYLKQEDIRQFTQKANANNITLEMLNRQPDYYTGMEVYFGGTVLQAIYNADDPQRVDLRIKEKLANSSQNVIYVSYTLEENQSRILEGDYVDMYGTFSGMFTYQSVGSGPITVPHVIGKVVYCYAHTNEPLTTPTMKAFEERVSGKFQAKDGTVFSFSTVKNAEMNYFSSATDYGDCIVAYFTPEIGWDENNPPPFYRVTAFQDGTMVIFEPNENAAEGIYTIDAGTYTEYTFIDGSDYNSTAPSSYDQSNLPSVSNKNTTKSQIGYVTESSGGLKIRSGPSTSYEEVGRLAPWESVTIFEIQNNGNRDWGRIDRGWVCMDYIQLGTPSGSTHNTTNTSGDIIVGEYVDPYYNVKIVMSKESDGEYRLTYSASGVTLSNLPVLYYNQDTPTEKMIMFSIDEYYPQYSGYVEFCVGGSMAYSYNALIDGLDDSYGYYQILEKNR